MAIITTPLPYPKIDKVPVPASEDPRQYIVSSDWNTVCAVLDSVRTNGGGGGAGSVPFIVANDYAGADIGAQINAADADLGAGPGTIVVLPGDYTISTQIVLGSYHRLLLPPGLFDTNMTAGPIFVMKSFSTVQGSGWMTRISEPKATFYGDIWVFRDYDTIAGDTRSPGSTDIEIKDFQIVPGSLVTSANIGSITFGNTKRVTVQNVFFNQSSGFSVVFGGDASLGNLSVDCNILDCFADRCATQVFAYVNAISFKMCRNTIKAAGQRATASTPIDVELNGDPDQCSTWIISDNIIDGRGAETAAGVGIQISATRDLLSDLSSVVASGRIGIMSNNIIYGDDYPTPNVSGHGLGIGIRVAQCASLILSNNIVHYCPIAILVENCVAVSVKGNSAVNCGTSTVGQGAILLVGSVYCTVQDNDLHFDNALVPGGGGHFGAGNRIVEKPGAYGIYTYDSDYNLVVGNRLFNIPEDSAASGDSNRIAYISIYGAHSRQHGNFINNYATDDGAIYNTADLRAAYGAEDGGNRGLVRYLRIAGNVTPGDGGDGIWYWDPASTRTDNTVTVVKPALVVPNVGRWIKAPVYPKYTTTARNALSVTSLDIGFTILNTTLSEIQWWNGTVWANISGTGGGGGSTVAVTYAAGTNSSDQTEVIDTGTGGPHVLRAATGYTGVLFQTQEVGFAAKASILYADGGLSHTVQLESTLNGSAQMMLIKNNTLATTSTWLQGNIVQLGVGGSRLQLLNQAINTVMLDIQASAVAPNDLVTVSGGSANRWTETWSRVYAGVHLDTTSGGAVSINTQLGEMQVLTSNANVSGITLTAGKAGQVFTLELKQGNAGHTWPTTFTNARIAGGSFTKSAALNDVDTITFRYNTTSSTWDEISRVLALA